MAFFETATVLGFLTVVLGFIGLWWDVRRTRSDNTTLKEGIAALYRVVESNKQVVESLLSQATRSSAFEQDRLALQKSQVELDRLKTWGKFAKWLIDNSE